MVPSSRLSHSPFLIAGALLLLTGLLVGACDLLTGSTSGSGNSFTAAVSDSATLAYAHMPTGTTLPSPEEVPLRSGTVQAYEEMKNSRKVIPATSDSSSADSSGMESPYGCYLASHVSSDSTSFRSIYLYFPEEIVEAAGTETERAVYRVGKAEENEWVRYASCIIPDASGARTLAQEQVMQSGEEEALRETIADSAQASAAASESMSKGCVTFKKVELDYCVGGPCCSDLYCTWDVSYVTICGGGGGGDPGDGGPFPGGGGNPSGDGNNDGCEKNTGFPEPGSICEPDDPCESANPPVYCAWGVNDNEVCPDDPLKDMEIRATCDGIEGGRFGGRGGDHEGLDLRADVGTNLRAAAGGTIEKVGKDPGGWGKYIVIKSATNSDRFFLYAHLSSVGVIEGESINAKDIIGKTGTSGNACNSSCSCGPAHVHMEVREGSSQWYNANTKDPEGYVGTKFDSSGTAVSDSCPS